jgi:hypothetical protein
VYCETVIDEMFINYLKLLSILRIRYYTLFRNTVNSDVWYILHVVGTFKLEIAHQYTPQNNTQKLAQNSGLVEQ